MMSCATTLNSLKILVTFFFIFLSPGLFAGDGPQNTGRVQLKKITKSQLEATFQADKTAFSNPKNLFEVVSVTQNSLPCPLDPPQMISNEQTLSATSIYRCSETISEIQVSLVNSGDFPKGFSMGIQTPFEHFSLSQEIPGKKTQMGTTQIFFSKGFFLGTFKDEVINRPYALSFGGLNFFPWGIWWLCLLGALATSCLNQKSKFSLLSLSVVISGGLSYAILKKEASLKYISIPRLDLVYLMLCGALAALGFFQNNRSLKNLSLFLGLLLVTASGFEWAILLRWLEGNTQVSLVEAVSSFSLGVLVASTLLIGLFVFGILSSLFTRLAVLVFTLYASLALLL